MNPIQGAQGPSPVQTSLDPAPGASPGGPTAPPLLPEPDPCGLGDGSMAALAMLLTRADEQDRTSAREQNDAASSAAMQQASQQVQAMRDKAGQDLGQAMATGVGELAGGALVAASGFAPDAASKGVSWRPVAEGAGRAMPGVGSIVAGGYKAGADQDDAQATLMAAQSQASLRQADQAQSDAQAADAEIDKLEQLVQSVVQTQAQAGAAAASMLRG